MQRVWVAVSALLVLSSSAAAQTPPAPLANVHRVATQSLSELRSMDTLVDAMSRTGALRLRQHRADPLLPSRTHDRFDQFHRGVRVFGGDLVRQDQDGLTTSVFGTIYENITVDSAPTLTPAQARDIIARLADAELPDTYEPELVILPRDAGGYALAYSGRAFGSRGLYLYFVDAHTGSLLLSLNDLKSQSAIGRGDGVLGDPKKVSVNRTTGSYRTEDELRPPALLTYDLKGNLNRVIAILNGLTPLTTNDLAIDTDNTWTDPAIVDAHAYSGWVYDFLFKRFGRRGLDDADIAIRSIVHPANRQVVLQQPTEVVGLFYLNAFYAGSGVMVFGEGLPSNVIDGGRRSWNYLAGALDVFAHELTHGITDYSSRLIYRNESGALNEAFSDIMGIAAEFYFQPAGGGPLKADYRIGEDVITPGGLRTIDNPQAFGDPDHYTRRYTGADDNGGVHTNSTIASHAFYLAVEGGVNRTSGLSVTGVGGAQREQIEKAFYRAFTQMLPSDATFAVARAATIQAARDLYGADSAAVRAVTEAWSAVGVN